MSKKIGTGASQKWDFAGLLLLTSLAAATTASCAGGSGSDSDEDFVDGSPSRDHRSVDARGAEGPSALPDRAAVVPDPSTSLNWFRCPVGEAWDAEHNACVWGASYMDIRHAKRACAELGGRLPTGPEFSSILANCSPRGACDSCADSPACSSMFDLKTGIFPAESSPDGNFSVDAYDLGEAGPASTYSAISNRVRCVL